MKIKLDYTAKLCHQQQVFSRCILFSYSFKYHPTVIFSTSFKFKPAMAFLSSMNSHSHTHTHLVHTHALLTQLHPLTHAYTSCTLSVLSMICRRSVMDIAIKIYRKCVTLYSVLNFLNLSKVVSQYRFSHDVKDNKSLFISQRGRFINIRLSCTGRFVNIRLSIAGGFVNI